MQRIFERVARALALRGRLQGFELRAQHEHFGVRATEAVAGTELQCGVRVRELSSQRIAAAARGIEAFGGYRVGAKGRIDVAVDRGLQREQLFVYDLALAPGLQPRNQDGEVASLQLLPVAEALALAAGDTMTVDAALATLDFALRWRLLGEREQAALTARTAGLFGAMPD